MALNSREFVGKAEGIKSHELSLKSSIENLKEHLSTLDHRKDFIEKKLMSMYAQLNAARNNTSEDGESNYGRIASIELQIEQAEENLDDVERKISKTSDELDKTEEEFLEVEEEKKQTLFEIQQRARNVSQNISKSSGMYGAYADIGTSLTQSFQQSLDLLAQAAVILGGAIQVSGDGSGTAKSSNRGSSSQIEMKSGNFIGGTTASILGANSLAIRNSDMNSVLHSAQKSTTYCKTAKKLHFIVNGNSKNNKKSTFCSKQTSVKKDNSGIFKEAEKGKMTVSTTQKGNYISSGKVSNPTMNRVHSKKMVSEQSSFQKLHNNSKSNIERTAPMIARHGRNAFVDSVIVQDWELGKYCNSSMSSLRKNIAKADYEAYIKSPNDYEHISYNKKSVIYIDPSTINEIRGIEDPNFWSYKSTSYSEYIDMAKQIPLVYSLIKSGRKLTELKERKDIIGVCVRNYFLNDDITVTKVGNGYIFGEEGRHRIMAALIAGVNIPVRLTDEFVKKKSLITNKSSQMDNRNIKKIKYKEEIKAITIPEKIASADKKELENIVKNEQIARNVNFGEIDIDIAREVINTIWNVKIKYPFLELPYIGSRQVINKKLEQQIEYYLTQLYIQNNSTEDSVDEIIMRAKSEAKFYIKENFEAQNDNFAFANVAEKPEKIKKPKPGMEYSGIITEYIGDVIASEFNGICINEQKAKNYNQLCQELIEQEQRGASPRGCDTIQYLTMHEIAHHLDKILQISKDDEIISMYKEFKGKSSESKINSLCLYADEDIGEFIAEAWAESQCSATPRDTAKLVEEKMKMAIKMYLKKKEDDDVRQRELKNQR